MAGQIPPDVKSAVDRASSHPHALSSDPPQIDPREDLQSRLAAADTNIQQIMLSIDKQGRYVDFSSGPGTQAWNPALYAKSVARLGAALGTTGLALFAAEQLGLFLLNRHGKIWNPLTAAPLPIAQNFIPAALDVLTGTPQLLTGYDDTTGGWMENFHSSNHGPGKDDRHLAFAKGNYNEVRIVHYPPFIESVQFFGRVSPTSGIFGERIVGAASQDQSLVDDPHFGTADAPLGKPLIPAALELRNRYFPGPDFDGPTSNKQGQPFEDFATPGVDQLIDDILDAKNDTKHLTSDPSGGGLLRYTYKRTDDSPKVPTAGGKLATMFLGKSVAERTGEWRPDRGDKTSPMSFLPLAKAAFVDGIIPSAFKNENGFGFVTHARGKSPTDKIKDDEAYLPLSFTDLRPAPGNIYRTVYVRPFIKSLSEHFAPEWNKQTFFCRTDAVASYVATGRSINLAFDMIAFGPEDLETIYQKLNWLSSMVYPKYDKNLLYNSGPVIRLRVGNVVDGLGSEGARGLPGFIESLDFDYSETLWELKSDWKVPRNIAVSLSFLVLHDRPIGIGAEGKFGGLGTIDQSTGIFVPPGRTGNPGPGNGDNAKFPEIIDGLDSFRTVGGKLRNSMNDYQRLTDVNNSVADSDK